MGFYDKIHTYLTGSFELVLVGTETYSFITHSSKVANLKVVG